MDQRFKCPAITGGRPMVITFDPTDDQALFRGKIKQSSTMLPMKIPYSLLQMG